jgi:nitrile hydratase accessory protein
MSISGKTIWRLPDDNPRAAINELPALPCDQEGPVFNEPWEAQAFALAVRLSEAGYFTWSEWATVLSQEIKAAQAQGDPDLGQTYYQHWLNALERICVDKGLVGLEDMRQRLKAWRRAYLCAPHGQPVELSAADKPGHPDN